MAVKIEFNPNKELGEWMPGELSKHRPLCFAKKSNSKSKKILTETKKTSKLIPVNKTSCS